MKQHLAVLSVLCLCFFPCFVSKDIRMNPRLTQHHPGGTPYLLPREEPMASFYLDINKSMYIGGEEVLYHFNLTEMRNYSLKADSYESQREKRGENCQNQDGEKFTRISERWTQQLSPRTPDSSYSILNTGNETYSTIPRGSSASTRQPQFRKIFGSGSQLYTGDKLLINPLFVKSLVVKRKEEKENKIFLFYMDVNSQSRSTESEVPMIAQMCEEEIGSDAANERFRFSTALKSRLICGTPTAQQYYPFLQDIYFLESRDLLYGLFTNAWNHSAVCSYQVEDIERVFNTSGLFGSSRTDLSIRPGTCLGKKPTPEATADEVANYPELTSWIWPLANQTLFQSLYHYRKLVVDEITAVDEKNYRIVLLATDEGTVHKVVELPDGFLNVLELHPFSKPAKILHFHLHTDKTEHVLYVAAAQGIYRLPLDDCTSYNESCTDCIISKDPYCGWSEGKCHSILVNKSSRVLQNLAHDDKCNDEAEIKILPRRTEFHKSSGDNAELPPSKFYLECPTESKQARYWWTYGNSEMKNCTPNEDQCMLLFDRVTSPGEYHCMSQELSTVRVVRKYTFAMNYSGRMQCSWLVVLAFSILTVYYIL
ncbi:semaphorin-7A isoform X2 [Hyperolius riggenbachi]|uniref:semaphorin-7A isoform X2 n=1 Tax=Hyperolius riggenbachi TaxID=752182 RepID=UPI0035A2DEC8